jgi:hypothetical protein
MVKTPMGVILLENVPENAVVELDGDKITVTPTVRQLLTIETKAGGHVVVARRGTQVFMAESVDVEAGTHCAATPVLLL